MTRKEKKERSNLEKMIFTSMLVIFILTCFLTLTGSFQLIERGNLEYHRGFHNIDLGHNLNTLQERFNTSLYDRTNLNTTISPSELVITGVNQMDSGFSKILSGHIVISTLFTTVMFLLFITVMVLWRPILVVR